MININNYFIKETLNQIYHIQKISLIQHNASAYLSLKNAFERICNFLIKLNNYGY